jgi:hypothetical protein
VVMAVALALAATIKDTIETSSSNTYDITIHQPCIPRPLYHYTKLGYS